MDTLILYEIRRLEQAHLHAENQLRRTIRQRLRDRRNAWVAARGGRDTGRPSSSPAPCDPQTFTRAS